MVAVARKGEWSQSGRRAAADDAKKDYAVVGGDGAGVRDASKEAVLERRIAFVEAKTEAGRKNLAALGAFKGLGDYKVHVVESKVTENAMASAQAPDAARRAQTPVANETPKVEDPFLKYLPKAEDALYPDAKDGAWDALFKWQSSGPPGPGLDNMGNTCFLNSVLQCLTFSPLFAQLCLSKPASHESIFANLKSETLSAIAARARSQSKDSKRFFALEIIASHMQAVHMILPSSSQHKEYASSSLPNQQGLGKSRLSVEPLAFVLGLRKLSLSLGIQHDAHEFLRILVDSMQQSCAIAAGFPATSSDRRLETSAVMRVFGGYTESSVHCSRAGCGASSSNFEPFMDLSLDVCDTLEAAMGKFLAPELLDDGWDCPSCGRVSGASKQLVIRQCPNTLVFHLKRFGYSAGARKIKAHLAFPLCLDMSKFVKESMRADYDLTGVVVHFGSTMNLGHYVCFVKASNGTWYRIDDEIVQQVGESTVLAQEAYLLFYSRAAMSDVTTPESTEPRPTGALAAFAMQFASPDRVEPQQDTQNARPELFGSFLGSGAGKETSLQDQGGREDGLGEEGDREASRQFAALQRRMELARIKPWRVWFSKRGMSTSAALRQLYIQRQINSSRRRLERRVLKLAMEQRMLDLEEASEPEEEALEKGDASFAKASPDLQRAAPAGEEDGRGVTANQVQVKDGRNSTAVAEKQLSKSEILQKAAASDDAVLFNHKRRHDPAQGKDAWAKKLQDAKANKVAPNKGKRTAYDEWDAALDRGKLKKVKSAEPVEKKPAFNPFQRKQDRANDKERRRKGK